MTPRTLKLALGGSLALAALLLVLRALLADAEPAEGRDAAVPAAAAPEEAAGSAEAEELVVPPDPAETAPAAAPGPVRGRVVLSETWRPVAGAAVLLRDGRDVERTETDDEGRFELSARKDRGSPELVCLAEPGRVQAGGPRALTPDEALGRSEVELVLEPAPTARFAGVALDARTGEPVPALRLHVTSPVGFEELATSADGSFASEGAWPAALWRVDAVDDDGERTWGVGVFELPAGPELAPWRLEVEVGPTYVLDALRTDDRRWRAKLVQRAWAPDNAGRLVVDASGDLSLAEGAPDPPSVHGEPAAVRPRLEAGGIHASGAWVRFPFRETAGEDEPDPRRVPWLDLRCDDLLGRTRVSDTVGVEPRPLVAELFPNATVRGEVTTAEGNAVPGVRVWIVPDGSADWSGPHPDVQRARMEGDRAYVFDVVRPGMHRVVALAPGFRTDEQPAHATGGPLEVAPLRLPRPREEPELSGSLIDTESGGTPVAALVRPMVLAPHGPAHVALFELEGAGREPQLHLEGLPADELRLLVLPARMGARPALARVVAPVHEDRQMDRGPSTVGPEFLEVLRRLESAEEGPEPGGPAEILRRFTGLARRPEVVGADGARLARLALSVVVDGGVLPLDPSREAADVVWFGGAAREVRCWAPQHRPRTVKVDELGEEEPRIVRLQPGWGAALHFRERLSLDADLGLRELRELPDLPRAHRVAASPPLAGVRVTGPGVGGVADATGALVLESPLAPAHLDVQREGWRVRSVEPVWPRSAAGAHRELVVWMVSDAPDEGWGVAGD